MKPIAAARYKLEQIQSYGQSDPGTGGTQYIKDHLSEELTLDEPVTVAETSASSLLRIFKLRRDTTPMRYVKQLRLEAVHRSLLAADPGETKVSDLAADFGFFQFGRFASDYRRAFGELPSETLRV